MRIDGILILIYTEQNMCIDELKLEDCSIRQVLRLRKYDYQTSDFERSTVGLKLPLLIQ